jgi:hypothetical protein
VVGVGRTTHRPPGWLTDAIAAVYDTCTEPGCHTAARVCDNDHATRWADGGRTDADNLAPLCATTNRGTDRNRWEITQHPDGTRVWHHPRTGLTTRTVPATWRPHHATTVQDGDGPDRASERRGVYDARPRGGGDGPARPVRAGPARRPRAPDGAQTPVTT